MNMPTMDSEPWLPTARTGERPEDLSPDEWIGQALSAMSTADDARAVLIEEALKRYVRMLVTWGYEGDLDTIIWGHGNGWRE